MRKWSNFTEFCVHVIMGIDIVLIGILLIPIFSVPAERAAITAGDDLRGLGICHQQAFWQEKHGSIKKQHRSADRFSKIRPL